MTSSEPAAAITAMWVCDNSVPAGVDPRGDGYAPAAPDRLAAFARAGGLREVHLRVPPVPVGDLTTAGTGPVADWLRAAVATLHDAGVAVTAVADVRDATTAWATATTALAPVDRLAVVVAPWVGSARGHSPAGRSPAGYPVVEALTALAAAGTGVPVDACVPWWFAHESSGDGRTLLESVLGGCDRVLLATPGPHALGPDGVLERAAAGVATLSAAGRRFSIAVETDTPDAVGGADGTFWDEGPVAMIRECGVVASELAGAPGFEGVAVRSHRAWRRLMGV